MKQDVRPDSTPSDLLNSVRAMMDSFLAPGAPVEVAVQFSAGNIQSINIARRVEAKDPKTPPAPLPGDEDLSEVEQAFAKLTTKELFDRLLRASGMTQRELARKVGVHESQLSRMLARPEKSTHGTIMKIADVLADAIPNVSSQKSVLHDFPVPDFVKQQ